MLKIEDLKVGNVLVSGIRERKIESIVDTIVIISGKNSPGGPCLVYTIEQLNWHGYKLKPNHPELKVDQPLIVWDDNGEKRRYFAYEKDGLLYCWCNGNTKWTAEGSATPWDHYRLPTDEELNSYTEQENE